MSVNSAAAARVAKVIGAFKWVVIVWQVLAGVVLLFVLNAQESWPTWTAGLGPLALVALLLSAVGSWVLFGWFQHTLGMLAAIAGTVTAKPGLVMDVKRADAALGRQAGLAGM